MTAWSPDRFAWIDWEGLTQSNPPDCAGYATKVQTWIAAEQDGDRKEALQVIWVLLSLHITWRTPDGMPLQPASALHSVPRDAVVALVAMLDQFTAAELRTRFADAAWLKGRACSPQIASQCAREYLDLARARYVPDDWVGSFSFLRRALDLAAQLARRQELFTEVSNGALDMLRRAAPGEPLYFSLRAIELLLEYNAADPAALAEIAEDIATRVEASGDVLRPREYLEGAARCWDRAKKPERRTAALRRVAGLLEQQAALHRGSPDGALAASMCLEQAVEVYRRAGGATAEVARLKPELQRARAEGVAAMKPTELGSLNVEELRDHARASIKGKTSWEALVALVTISQPIPLDRLREQAREQIEAAPFSASMDSMRITTSGQVAHRRPALDDAQGEDALLGPMHDGLSMYHQVLAMGGIIAGLEQLQFEHGLSEPDFFYLASRSAFVPEGREAFFARGLSAGAVGDFITAAHLLMPQFEHSIRSQLNRLGVSTLTLPTSGVQNELDLNALLDRPELRALYDEATIFDWKNLLTEKTGANLRNELAHGLVDLGARQAEQIYFWWMTLRSVIAPILAAATPTDAPNQPRGGER